MKKNFPLGRPRPRVWILYICDCGSEKRLSQPYPQEPHNTDHRMFCAACAMIKNHKRILPPKPEP